MKIEKYYYIANDDYECSSRIYGDNAPVCIDLAGVERLALKWDMRVSQLLDRMHEADADEIAKYGVYDSDKSVIFQTGFILGQAVKFIQDKGESGWTDIQFEKVKKYPWRWLLTEASWIARYGLNYALLEHMATRAQTIIDSDESIAKDEYRAGVVVGYMAAQFTF